MKKNALMIQIIIFCAFISGFFVLNLAMPDKEFSERENRYLTSLPKFSLNALASGKFTRNVEDYIMDQFAFRDSWTALKARSELALGKKENRDVYLGDGEVLIERFDRPDYALIDSNIAAVNSLAEDSGVPVYFALVPGAAGIWSDNLPKNAPNYSQTELITYIYDNSEAIPIDMYGRLNEHKSEYIYYRTDHHWTTIGAYYGYQSLSEALGFVPAELSSFDRKTVSEDFYGAIYSASGFSWVKPDSIEIFVEPDEGIEVVNYPSGSPVAGMIYDESFLEKKDKYSMFMGGNTPQLQIKTGNADGGNLLILRDSYMDSLTPFLLSHFSEIHILDLRYYKLSVFNYIEENAIDNVLVCYSLKNFVTDATVFLAGK